MATSVTSVFQIGTPVVFLAERSASFQSNKCLNASSPVHFKPALSHKTLAVASKQSPHSLPLRYCPQLVPGLYERPAQGLRRISSAQKPRSSPQGQEFRVGQAGSTVDDDEVPQVLNELREEILSMYKEGDVAGSAALMEANAAAVLEQVRDEEAGEEQIAMLLALANCCRIMKMEPKSKALVNEASLLLARLEEESVVRLEIVDWMGDAYVDLGLGKEALQYYMQALQRRGGEDEEIRVVATSRQALHLLRSGMESEACSLYHSLAERFEDTTALPELLVGFGTLLLNCGRVEEAREVCQRALDLQREQWGASHLNTGMTTAVIAHCMMEIASLQPGVDLLRSAIAILEEHNDDSPDCKNFLQQARNELASIVETHEQYEESVDLLERNFKTVVDQIGSEDSLLLGPIMQLAQLHFEEGEFGRSITFLDQALQLITSTDQNCDYLLCRPLVLKSLCELKVGRGKAAEGLARAAVQVAEKHFAPNDEATDAARQALAAVLSGTGKHEEAVQELLLNLNNLTDDSRELCETAEDSLRKLIAAYAAGEEYEKLEGLRKRFSLTESQVEAALDAEFGFRGREEALM